MTPTQRIERLEAQVADLSRTVRQLLEQRGQSPAAPADPLAQKEAEVRACAAELGIAITSAGIKEKYAAKLLDKSIRTLQNWRQYSPRMKTTRVGRTHYYATTEIAAFLIKSITE